MKAALQLPDSIFIRAGYSANADIILDKRSQVITIAESAVEFSGDSTFVHLLTSEKPQAFERKQIEIGLSDGIHIEVKEGLQENNKVRGSEIIEQK
ncbi:MAG: efflux transporter periplasmic adaptor subunit, partial [Proteiniphilum sp.]|nr:efflux transporter periplasmic adaptor subunit [Proteiniphilum sp.]